MGLSRHLFYLGTLFGPRRRALGVELSALANVPRVPRRLVVS